PLAPSSDKNKTVRKESSLELIEDNSSMKVDEITIISLENVIKDMVEATVISSLSEEKNSMKKEETLMDKESDSSDFIYIQSPILNTSVSQDQTAPRVVQAFKEQMKGVEPNNTRLEGADEDGFTL
ncbi:5984_t:CDS:1, partial [Dentiscutata heterogama]